MKPGPRAAAWVLGGTSILTIASLLYLRELDATDQARKQKVASKLAKVETLPTVEATTELQKLGYRPGDPTFKIDVSWNEQWTIYVEPNRNQPDRLTVIVDGVLIRQHPDYRSLNPSRDSD